MPRWNTISISGYHMAEAGATPAQEIAFTLANGIEYVRAALAAGLDVDDFAPRLSFFFVARTTLLEEVAKFRAARRIWAQVMRDEFGAKNPKSHDAALPHPDRRRAADRPAARGQPGPGRACRGSAAVLGGTQSLHTNSFDEAIALPTEKAARLALRTQQVHRLRDRRDQDRRPVRRLVRRRVDDRRRRGRGARADAGGRGPGRRRRGDRAGLPEERDRAVGLPRSRWRSTTASGSSSASTGSRSTRRSRTSRCGSTRRSRPSRPRGSPRCAPSATTPRSTRRSTALQAAARGTDNVLYPMKEALAARATVGEVCDALREVWGTYPPRETF